MTLEQARQHIGSPVMFRGGASSEDEPGVITGVGARYVYVRYARARSEATRPENLELVAS